MPLPLRRRPALRVGGWLPRVGAPGNPGPVPLPPTTKGLCIQRPCKVGKMAAEGKGTEFQRPPPPPHLSTKQQQPRRTRQRSAGGNWSPGRGGPRRRESLSGTRGRRTPGATPWTILETSHLPCVTSWDPPPPQVLQSSSHTHSPTWGLKAPWLCPGAPIRVGFSGGRLSPRFSFGWSTHLMDSSLALRPCSLGSWEPS